MHASSPFLDASWFGLKTLMFSFRLGCSSPLWASSWWAHPWTAGFLSWALWIAPLDRYGPFLSPCVQVGLWEGQPTWSHLGLKLSLKVDPFFRIVGIRKVFRDRVTFLSRAFLFRKLEFTFLLELVAFRKQKDVGLVCLFGIGPARPMCARLLCCSGYSSNYFAWVDFQGVPPRCGIAFLELILGHLGSHQQE